jgi:hypothetical protein
LPITIESGALVTLAVTETPSHTSYDGAIVGCGGAP